MRDAVASDIPHIVELGERMAARADISFDRDSVAITLQQLIDSPDGILLVSETGMFGGICYPQPFNHAIKTGQELFWYSEGGDGPDLLAAAEERARLLGVTKWGMFAQATMRPKVVGRYYERRGYRPDAYGYVKDL